MSSAHSASHPSEKIVFIIGGQRLFIRSSRLLVSPARRSIDMQSNCLLAVENTFEVNLNRGHAGLGLSLSGGLAENRPIEIIDIYRNQPAAQSGQLEIGDVILAINEHPMHNRNVRVRS